MAPMTWLGSNAALAILSFDVDAESPILAVSRRYAEHPSAMSHQRYGPLVAVPRLLRLLEDLGVPATFFVPGWTAERYPESVERILAAGQEVAHHGHSHRSPVHMDEAEERRDLEAGWRRSAALACSPRATGRRAGSRARGPSTCSRSTALRTTRRSWTTTGRTSSRPRTVRSWSCLRTGGSTTGASTCTSRTPARARAPSIHRRGRSRSGARNWTGCAVTEGCSC